MLSINPYATLAENISPSAIQGFVLAMIALIVIGTVVQMIHHKNVTYFFNNAKKAKLAAERELGIGEKTSVILKTVVHDIATTAELGAGKRRVAHVMGMYGTILFWVASVVLVFVYTGKEITVPITIKANIAKIKPWITEGEIDSANTENGLIDII